MPLTHPPGHAQVELGEAIGVVGGIERKFHLVAMDLLHSNAIFVVACAAETTEAFCDGHFRAIEFFGDAPRLILEGRWEDETKLQLLSIHQSTGLQSICSY